MGAVRIANRLRRIGAVGAVVAIPILGGCGPSVGEVSGHLETVGGPAPGLPRPVPGAVVMVDVHGHETTVHAGTDGTFMTDLAPGAYTVTGTSPEVDSGHKPCGPDTPLSVTPGQTAFVTLACQIR